MIGREKTLLEQHGGLTERQRLVRLLERFHTIPEPTACRYCGHVAARFSDDDCPARPINRARRALERLLQWARLLP